MTPTNVDFSFARRAAVRRLVGAAHALTAITAAAASGRSTAALLVALLVALLDAAEAALLVESGHVSAGEHEGRPRWRSPDGAVSSQSMAVARVRLQIAARARKAAER